MPFNDAVKNAALDAMDETGGAVAVTHIGIATLSDPGTGTNANAVEATGGSPAYARQAVTWGAAASGQKTGSSGTLTFDVPAGTYGFFLLFNASTGNTNNYRGYIPFGGASALKGFGSSDVIANDQFRSAAHGMSDGDRVMLFNVFSETLPTGTGLTEGAILYVVSSATDTFKVSTTAGGAAIDITALGGGEAYWQRVVPETFNSQGQITVAANALVLDATAM